MITQKLKALKEKSKLTNQQIADLSGIPLSTVNRIISGDTPNPQFQTIADLVKAMGGSLDEFCEIPNHTASPAEIPKPTHELIQLYREIIADKNILINEKEKLINEKNKDAKIAIFMFCGLLIVIIIFLLVDIFNGHFGYFRY